MSELFLLQTEGYCPCCAGPSTFRAENPWLRDNYLCMRCGSQPRERAIMLSLDRFFPLWKSRVVHESSPVMRGATTRMLRECPSYFASQLFPGIPLGQQYQGVRCEDLERLSFPDESIDLHVTQDVLEHVLDPAAAFREIARTLRPGGAHIFTTPLVRKEKTTERRAHQDATGAIVHLYPPEYHGNPVSSDGALVTMHWGYDIADFIFQASRLNTTIVYLEIPEMGIVGDYIEVCISRKSPLTQGSAALAHSSPK